MDTANAAPAGVNKLPLLLTLPYLLGTYALFWFGPFSWPVKATWVTTLYVPACFTALTLGFLVGLRAKPRVADLPMTHAFFLGGAIAALLLLVPTAYIYTGKLPWEAGSALADQQAAYSALADQLYATQGSRGPVALLDSTGESQGTLFMARVSTAETALRSVMGDSGEQGSDTGRGTNKQASPVWCLV